MEIIQVCPQCGFPAIGVNEKAVKFNIIASKTEMINKPSKWSVCNNPDCDCTYFSKNIVFKTTDLNTALFFKDNSDDVPICYCSNLTRGEIQEAVKNGCKTIDDVQNYTRKNITGFCEERNPLGKCCRNVFLKTIANAGILDSQDQSPSNKL
jgi:bacterioferritin-associated ferredoxin